MAEKRAYKKAWTLIAYVFGSGSSSAVSHFTASGSDGGNAGPRSQFDSDYNEMSNLPVASGRARFTGI